MKDPLEESSQQSDAEFQARARALSSPIRFRILRSCLHTPRTNKEIAELLKMNPATTLHHVRTLVSAGFLQAQEERTGRRGAKEIPYKSTRETWGQTMPHVSNIMIETFLQEIDGLGSQDMDVWRVGLKLDTTQRQEMMNRIKNVIDDYADEAPTPEGEGTSLMLVQYRDPVS